MSTETKDRHKGKCITFRCDPKTYESIKKITEGKTLTLSEVLRSLVADGLVRQGYTQDEDYLYKLVSDAVKEQLQPGIERLAAITKGNTNSRSKLFHEHLCCRCRLA